MYIALIGIVLGVAFGMLIPIVFSGSATIYISVGILAAIDSLFGAFRAHLNHRFNLIVFTSGFIINALLAGVLALIGDLLGLPLYYAAMFVFGTRLFNNLALIRRFLISKYTQEKF